MYNEIDQLVDQKLNEYLSSDRDFKTSWISDFDFFDEVEELSENKIALIKVDNLRNKLFNEYVNILEFMERTKNEKSIKLSYRQTNKYYRCYEYFKKFSDEKRNQWIEFPVDR